MNWKTRRILAKLNNPKYRTKLTEVINHVDQDETARISDDMPILREMNEMLEPLERPRE